MTEKQAMEAIDEAFKTAWDSLHPSIPYAFENEGFTATDGFARLFVQHSTGRQATLGPVGSRRFERRGSIFVQLFVGADQGRAPVSQLADDVRTILESVAITSGSEQLVTFGARTTEPSVTDGRWYMLTVVVPFLYYAVR